MRFVIGANTYHELAGIRDRMVARLRDYPGLINIDTDYQETQPQVRVDVDRDRAADIGVSVSAIGRTLETMLAGRRVTTYVDRGETVPFPPDVETDEDVLELAELKEGWC